MRVKFLVNMGFGQSFECICRFMGPKCARRLEIFIHLQVIRSMRVFTFYFLFFGLCLSSGAQQLSIRPVFGSDTLDWGKDKYSSAKGETMSFSTLELYLSDFTWTDTLGKEKKEPGRVELLEAGAEKQNLSISHPLGSLKRVCFRFGLDSATQVSGKMDGDLDPALGMYWAWNTGYIQCRLEGNSVSSKGKKGKFEFHLGGYSAPWATDQKVCLDLTNPSIKGKQEVFLDLKSLIDQVSLKKTHSVLIPGEQAWQLSHFLGAGFRSQLK